ncbi:hypothetical protein [Bacillus atrophaeus]|uniref:hypothetical protein n=1 Tax=Bacillus atrophaeus TaxID=1452 RepID=UPI002281272B|nr:hypothetical protein [Bacillus atrophaeus]MCY8840447.1 hypothetical protein [Bacillus atrophaeus]MEC0803598.1 hypothetical protein [Bacillus atrophaeus]MEC0854207.1 hypothetical protein [Bacillus atrophaeus]MEC0857409.1 hypothetical protein [Bacillus atrophaeus]MEC0860904.1 hypothetical protein [Bacillus atrophaeus]
MKSPSSILISEGLLATAAMSEFIDRLMKKKNYSRLVVIICNLLFSAFISLFPSSLISFIISMFNNQFLLEFKTYYFLSMMIFILMILANLFAEQINIPMILLRITFYIKLKYKSATKTYVIALVTTLILCGLGKQLFNILFSALNRYGVQEEIAGIMSIILAIGITISGYYMFPTNKQVRDINELLLSPFFIIISIGMSYVVSERNMITNFAEGNREISAYILAVFMLTAINQIINYLKKLFEKMHESPENKETIDLYTSSAWSKYVSRRKQFKKQLGILKVNIIKLCTFIKKNYKNKRFYIKTTAIVALFIVSYFILKKVNIFLSEFKIPEYIINFLSPLFIIGVFLYILFKMICLTIFKLRGAPKEKFVVLKCFSILLFFLSAFLYIITDYILGGNSHHLTNISAVLFGVASILYAVSYLVEWLISARGRV